MPTIKALRPHENGYGATFRKEAGDTYEHPAPQSLIDNNLAEIVNGENSEDRRAEGTGGGAAGTTEVNPAKHSAKGAEKTG